ncbi:MAG: BACON domain-containing protein [Rikenellaceae bacterium]
MKKNLLFSMLLSAMALFSLSFMTSCDNADVEETGSPSLVLSTSGLTFDADGAATDGSNGQVTITSNRDWIVEIPSSKDWLTVDVESGSGNGTITFSASATQIARNANVAVKLYNDSGYILEETIVVTQAGSDGSTDVTAGSATFDGSELTTSYPDNATITVGDAAFTVNLVANFSSLYNTSGPIQFMKNSSYIYNQTPFGDLKSIVILMAPKSTTFNNFTVYAGSEMNPTATEVEVSQDGDIATYTIPEGTTYVSIYNTSDFASYAFQIEFLCGDDQSTAGDYEYSEDDEEAYVAGQLTIDGASNTDIPTSSSSEDAVVITGGASFVINKTYISSYGSLSSSTGGYLYNITAFEGLTKVVVTEDYTYYNYSLCAGTEPNPTTEISYTKSGDYYTYTIPDGCKYITLINNSTYTAYGDVVDFYFDSLGETADTDIPTLNPDEGDSYEFTAGDLTLDATISDFPSSASDIDALYVTDNASFVVNNIYLNTSYNSFSTAYGSGSIYNLTAFEGLTQVIITEDYTYYNLALYAGTEVNPTTEVSYTKEGNYYIYTIPTGSKYITIANNSTYSASADAIDFYFDSLGETADFTAPEGGDEGEGGSVIVNDGVINVTEVAEALEATSSLTEASSEFALDGLQYTEGDITVSFDKGTSSYMRIWNASGTLEFRFYSGNILTIESTKEISEIVFDVTSGYSLDEESSTSTKKVYNFTATTKPKSITVVDGDGSGSDDDTTTETPTMTIDAAADFYAASGSDTVCTLDGASFVANAIEYSDYYGNYTISSGGYLYNLTALEGFTKLVIEEDGSFYNYTVYAGTDVNPSEVVDYTKDGDYYIYEIPAGSKYFKIGNSSTYGAYGTAYYLYYDSLGETAEFGSDDEGGSVIVNDGVINVTEVAEALEATSSLTEASSEFALDGLQYIEGDITVSFDKGTSDYMRLWNASGTLEFRFYKGNILTIESTKNISEIAFDVTSGYSLDEESSTSTKKVYNFTATTKPKSITVTHE